MIFICRNIHKNGNNINGNKSIYRITLSVSIAILIISVLCDLLLLLKLSEGRAERVLNRYWDTATIQKALKIEEEVFGPS